MPRYFCDYCDVYLTHDSAPGRKQHIRGWKHRENVKQYYEVYMKQFYDQNTVINPGILPRQQPAAMLMGIPRPGLVQRPPGLMAGAAFPRLMPPPPGTVPPPPPGTIPPPPGSIPPPPPPRPGDFPGFPPPPGGLPPMPPMPPMPQGWPPAPAP